METYLVKKKDNKLFLFKENNEIGQISPEAIWVKEGMEFDEKEWQEWTTMADTNLAHQIIKIKGPCGHFH